MSYKSDSKVSRTKRLRRSTFMTLSLMLAVYGTGRCFSSSIFSVSCCSKSLISTLLSFIGLLIVLDLVMSSAILVPDLSSTVSANLSASASKLSQTLCSVFLFFFRTSRAHKHGRMWRVLTASCYTAHL